MDRKPTRMSKHGYPIYEQPYKQEINDCIFRQGLETALKKYSKEEIEHHLGGKAYGAEIGSDYAVVAVRFDNSSSTWEEVKPILDLFEGIRSRELLGATLTKSSLVLQLKIPRLMFSDTITKNDNKIWDHMLKEHINAVKDLPYTKAVDMLPKMPVAAELRSWGLTDKEINERNQTLAMMEITPDEYICEYFKSHLVYEELAGIGVRRR